MKTFSIGLLVVIAVATSVLAFNAVYSLIASTNSVTAARASYENIVVVLLTTVTLIFTLSAVVLGVLSFVGPRAIKREAIKLAEKAVHQSIADAMRPGGNAAKMIEDRFPPNDGPTKDWMAERIERQVIALLPLIFDRVALRSDVGSIDPAAPEDEGDIA